MIRSFLPTIVAAISVAFVTAAPAAAQNAPDRYETRIAYADLDLSRNAGADALVDRIENAARQTCGDTSGRMSFAQHRRVRACNAAFMQRAVANAQSATVEQRYAARGGRVATITVAAR
ncbi:MAG: UrcA family protein [Phycisphaerales bacterium]|nr:UrcA family protein [Hyphomonadaceae bacterium]